MRYVIMIAAAMQMLPADLAGQGGDAQRRADCRAAERVIRTGNPEHLGEWALEQLSSCPEIGPVVAAELWRGAPSDTAGVAKIRWATQELRDQRLVDALLDVAQDAGRAAVTRKIAMLQLLTYAEPGDATALADLEPTDGSSWGAASRSHPLRHQEGGVPLSGTYRDDLLEMFRGIGEGDPDPSVQYAAGVLSRTLELPAGW